MNFFRSPICRATILELLFNNDISVSPISEFTSKFFFCGEDKIMLLKKIRQFLQSEDGPTAVEYAVMLALIVIVCLTAINSLGTNAKTTFTNVANSIGAS